MFANVDDEDFQLLLRKATRSGSRVAALLVSTPCRVPGCPNQALRYQEHQGPCSCRVWQTPPFALEDFARLDVRGLWFHSLYLSPNQVDLRGTMFSQDGNAIRLFPDYAWRKPFLASTLQYLLDEAQIKYRFPLTELPRARAHLAEKGFCVLLDAAGAHAPRLEDLLRRTMERFGMDGSKRGMPRAWRHGHCEDGNAGFHHSEWAWETRAALAPVFQEWHEAPRVTTSFQGLDVFHRDYPVQGPEWRISATRRYVQGTYLFTDSTAETGGLFVVPGSHRRPWWTRKDEVENSHLKVRQEIFLPAGHGLELEPMLVEAPRGSLVLWDSSMLHALGPGERPRRTFPRLALGVSMVPRRQEDRKSRAIAFKSWGVCNHRADKHIMHFPCHRKRGLSVALKKSVVESRYKYLL